MMSNDLSEQEPAEPGFYFKCTAGSHTGCHILYISPAGGKVVRWSATQAPSSYWNCERTVVEHSWKREKASTFIVKVVLVRHVWSYARVLPIAMPVYILEETLRLDDE